jgi:hypothetical protein
MWTLFPARTIERIPGGIDLGGRDPKWGNHECDVEWFEGKRGEHFANSFDPSPAAMDAKRNVGAQLRCGIEIGERCPSQNCCSIGGATTQAATMGNVLGEMHMSIALRKRECAQDKVACVVRETVAEGAVDSERTWPIAFFNSDVVVRTPVTRKLSVSLAGAFIFLSYWA